MNVRVYQLTHATPGEAADVLTVQGRGPGGAPDDAMEAVQAPGLRTHPVVRASTEAIVFELPNGDRFAFVIDKGASEGAVALEAGETQLRGCAMAASVVRIRANGDIELTPAAGRNVTLNVSGAGNVVLAGGTHAVAREGDAVAAGATMATWIHAVSTALTIPTEPTDFGTIAAGAPHVLG